MQLPFCSCRSSCPFAALRGQKEVDVAVLQLPFFVPLRAPSWTKRSCRCRSAVAALSSVDKMKLQLPFCSCRSSCPFAALRGQKEVAVAVLQLPFFVWPFVDKKKLPLPFCSCRSPCPYRGPFVDRCQLPSCPVAVLRALRGPSWTTRSCRCRSAVAVLQLPFFVPLRGPSWTKRSCRCRSAVAVLRAPSRPFVDKKKLPVAVLQLPFFVPLRDPSWTKRSCRCRSAVAVLRAPSWIKKVFPTTLRGQTTIEHTNRICLSSYIRTENRLPKTIQS